MQRARPGSRRLSKLLPVPGRNANQRRLRRVPYVLPSNVEPEAGLTVSNAAAAPYGLYIGLAWWIPGMLLAGALFGLRLQALRRESERLNNLAANKRK